MSKRSTAKYTAWPTDVLVYPKNADGSMPEPTNIIGGVGPFDFSGVTTISAVTLYSKIDTGATESDTVDLSGAADQSAVTVAELFAAINLAAPTDLTASSEAGTGRLKIAYSGAGDPEYVQVWGEAAEIGLIGYGKGARIAYLNTQQSLTFSPDRKDDEEITATDSNGQDVEIKARGYRKGSSGTLVDVADDWFLRSVIDGGDYDETAETYEDPTPDSLDVYFVLEYLYGKYGEGTSLENEIVGYDKSTVRNCTGYLGDETFDRNITTRTYNWTATNYKDSNGDYVSDRGIEKLSTAEYEAADFSSLASY